MRPWLRFKGESQDQNQEAIRSFVRFVAVAFIVAVVIIAIGEASRTDDANQAATPVTTTSDPIAVDLTRCRAIAAEQLATADTCCRVWAENRRRFFGPRKPGEAR